MTLPEVDGFKYVVVAIDYFSKWTEARPLKDKTAVSVARFLYDEVICRHGCPKIQINDQGREFVNNLNYELSLLTGTEQRVTSAYHPQANGLVERQNRTIKNCFLKVLQNNVLQWPNILQGILFAHRTAQHCSTGYTPFKLLYQREATLPVDIQFPDKTSQNQQFQENNDEDDILNISDVFNKESFNNTLNQMMNIRKKVEDNAKKNLDDAQKRQRYSYAKRHKTDHLFKEGDKVLVRNLYRDDRKGGWRELPWKGPYEIVSINSGNTCVIKNSCQVLKKKIHLKNLKLYNESTINSKNIANESKSEDIIMEDTYIVSVVNKQVFNPVTKFWQLRQSKLLNIEIKHYFNYKYKEKILTEPGTIKQIVGDGNCLFRSLSYCITGSEDHHMDLRKKIVEVRNCLL